MMKNHPFHLVTVSPWPLLLSLMVMNILFMTVANFHSMNYSIMMNIPCLLIIMLQWWRDVTREATFQGEHTLNVYWGMRLGMILFITSEVLFFFSFFWAYFHSSLAPNMEIGQLWPPMGIIPFNPFDIPLLNTIILISSGLSVTWTHHSLLNNNFKNSKTSLFITISLGCYFSILQMFEYMEAPFTMADSVYGATFFIATGFHGLHVIIGTIFLLVMFLRMKNLQFSSYHHFGFEAAAWYWHFVDVVWLFLYISIYCWGY